MDEAAERAEDEDIVVREQPALAEIDAALEVYRLQVAVEIEAKVLAKGRHMLAVLAARADGM